MVPVRSHQMVHLDLRTNFVPHSLLRSSHSPRTSPETTSYPCLWLHGRTSRQAASTHQNDWKGCYYCFRRRRSRSFQCRAQCTHLKTPLLLPFSNLRHPQLLAMKRVGVLHGDHPHGLEEKLIPPSQSLKIARYNELSSSYASSSWSDSEGMIR